MDVDYPVTLVKDLLPDSGGVNLLGTVICKHSPKVFKDTRGQNATRSVSSLTIRDQSGFINCNIWGSEEFVKEISKGYKICDVVIITNAQVSFKNASDDNFNPFNQTQFVVSIGEKQGGKVAACEGDFRDLEYLQHAPIRPHNDFYNLAEIFEHGDSIEGQLVNILAVVKKISVVQQLKTKNGRDLEKMEVTFFDNTLDTFTVVIWEPEYFEYVRRWSEKRSVIFVADVRLNFNKFKKCMQGSFTSKTICIQDPDTNEAHRLYDYALEYTSKFEELFGDEELLQIDELRCHTVKEIHTEINKSQSDPLHSSQLHGILYAGITSFNIDDVNRKPWSVRCDACKYRLLSDNDIECRNENCVTKEQPEKFQRQVFYDTLVSLSDHTGTLDQCRIGHAAIEKMFGFPVDQFRSLTSEELTKLKWSWLMERCKVRFRLNFDKHPVRLWIELCEKPSFEGAMKLINDTYINEMTSTGRDTRV